jgi:hypothetical protein
MKVIFMDVDGVLITGLPPFDWKTPDPKCVAALNRLLAAAPDLRIVVASCWRSGMARADLCDLFSRWGVAPGRVLDRTGEFLDTRGDEIRAWLTEHAQGVEKFAIVDDDKDMGDDLLPRLVQVDPATGFTDADATKVLALFQHVELE